MVGRQTIKDHIAKMKKRQEKVKSLIVQGKSLENIQAQFGEDEARLIRSIYDEIKGGEWSLPIMDRFTLRCLNSKIGKG